MVGPGFSSDFLLFLLTVFIFLVIMLLEEICFVKGEFSCYEIS